MRRRGAIIEIGTHLIEEAPHKLAEYMAQCKIAVLDVQHNLWNRTSEYMVVSELLPEIPLGEQWPRYNIVISKDGARLEKVE